MPERYKKVLTERVILTVKTSKTYRSDEEVFIHIRNYDKNHRHEVKMSLGQWKHLERVMWRIDQVLDDVENGKNITPHFRCRYHIGGEINVSVFDDEFEGVNIRHWRWNAHDVFPTRRRVTLLPEQ
jgi:hypothetical protein